VSLHRRRVHPDYVAGCFGCRVSTLHISPAAMVTRVEDDREYRFQKGFAREFENGDREAYRRLRQNGVQPPRIAGSAHLERHANTRYEIESGQIMQDQKALQTVMTMCSDGGFDPLTPAVQPKAD
jgi:hypothetical protein